MDITGTSASENLVGTSGNDTITGLAGNDTLQGGFGLDVYVFDTGSGNDDIFESSGTNGGIIRYGAGIAPEDIRFDRDEFDRRDLLILSGDDTIRVFDFYNTTGSNASNNQLIQQIEFDDGTILPLTGTVPFVGTDGSDNILGTTIAETITGLGGDDSLEGGSGLDVYVFDIGSGSDTITEQSGGNGGIIRYGTGITEADIRFERDAGDRRDLLILSGSDTIKILDFYNSTSTNASNNQLIQQIEFDGGGVLSLSGSIEFVGTTGSDDIIGTTIAETITGLAGDDSLQGGSGLDVYVFDSGSGSDTITEQFGSNGGIIRYGTGIIGTDIRFERDAGDRRDLLILSGSDTIKLLDFYNSTGTSASNSQIIQQIEFEGGSTLSLTGTIDFVGTSGDDNILGTNLAETITGLAGDDSLQGGSGLDVYVFDSGSGSDTITEQSGGNGGIIRYGIGITEADVRFERPASDRRDLLILTGNDTIEIPGFYNSTAANAVSNQLIQQIEFEDGSSLALDGAVPFLGTAGDDVIVGTNLAETLTGLAGNDDLSAGARNDTLDGGTGNDTLQGGSGEDLYLFDIGFGDDVITGEDSSTLTVDTV
ncbi:MAG: calcium-binding protein, partial [Pseudomonadota bacterium]